MSISFIATSHGTSSASVPGSVLQGDVAVVFAVRLDGGSISQPGGWATAASVSVGDCSCRVFYRSMSLAAGHITSPPGSGTTGTFSGATLTLAVFYRSSDSSLIVRNVEVSEGSGEQITIPAQSGLASGSWQVAFAADTDADVIYVSDNELAGYVRRFTGFPQACFWDSDGSTGGIGARTADVLFGGDHVGISAELAEVVITGGGGIVRADGLIVGTGRRRFVNNAVVRADGLIVGTGANDYSGGGSVAANGVVVGQGDSGQGGSGSVDAEGDLTGDGRVAVQGTGSVAAEGLVAGVGAEPQEAEGWGTIGGVGSVAGRGSRPARGSGSIRATGRLSANNIVLPQGTGSVAAEGVVVAEGRQPNGGSGSLVGEGEIEAVGEAIRTRFEQKTPPVAATLGGPLAMPVVRGWRVLRPGEG